jgi:hypothetical protein
MSGERILRTMLEAELRASAKCASCGKGFGHTGLPLFWRLKVERWGVMADAVRRQAGLEMLVGSTQLAEVFSPGEAMAAEVMQPVTMTFCETCIMKPIHVPALVEQLSTEEGDA